MLLNPVEQLKKLKERAKHAISKDGKIVMIPKDVFKFACSNEAFHGKMRETVVFRAGLVQNGKVIKRAVDEYTCSCGITYLHEK